MATTPFILTPRAEQSASVRLAQLQKLTAALSAAATIEEVGHVVTGVAREALVARSAALWIVEGDALVLVAHAGNSDACLEPFRRIPLTSNMPAATIVATRQPLWVQNEAEFTASSPSVALHARATGELKAYAALPLVVEDRVIGAVAWGYGPRHAFSEDEKAFIQTIVGFSALAIGRARLFEHACSAQQTLLATENRLAELLAREQAARAEAEQANRAKDDFFATLSHELRTPLNAITGWVSMLRADRLPPDRRAHALEVIERNAHAQEHLIADLLDMSRVISGKLRLDVRPFDLRAVVTMAIEAVRPAAAAKSLRLETALDDTLDPLEGDARRMQQVVWNLMSNAVKFSCVGGEVRVTLGREGGLAVLRVRDHGEGMAPEFLRHVFEPFRQADGTFARKSGGLGLGLAISRRFVEMHGGTIEAESDGPGRGTEVTVRLPLAGLRADSSPRVPVLTDRRSPPARTQADALEQTRVLVVEDEPDSRELVIELLEQHGALVTGAASAAEAVEAFRRAPPAIIVSDVGLPGEDGLSLMRRIRALPGGDRVIAVALTAFVRPEDRDRARDAGFDVHVSKPIEPHAFVRAVAGLARRPETPNDS